METLLLFLTDFEVEILVEQNCKAEKIKWMLNPINLFLKSERISNQGFVPET
jgi:hypothetical protein